MYKIIIVSGYGSSGSSALVDFLYDSGCVIGFGNNYPQETKVLHHGILNGLKDLFISGTHYFNASDFTYLISGGKFSFENAHNKSQLESIINQSLLNSKMQKKRSYPNEMILKEKIINRVNKNEFFDLDEALINSITNQYLPKKFISVEEIIDIYGKIIMDLIKVQIISENKIMLFNNDMHTYKKNSLIVIENSLHISVYRNGVDQYARKKYLDMIATNEHKINQSLISFIIEYNLTLLMTMLFYIRNFRLYYVISFESFLLKKDMREKIKNLINCSSKEQDKYFDLEYSLRNIKIPRKSLGFIDRFILNITTKPIYLLSRITFYRK